MAKRQPDMKYVSQEYIDSTCLELFHPELPHGRYCTKRAGHDQSELHGDHFFAWPTGSGEFLSAENAQAFLRACGGLPNGPGNDGSLFINEDGDVVMTLAKFKTIAGWANSALRHSFASEDA
ncbi:MAG: hypothetical protein U0516_01170 [Candidatus Saccharibacteria bacterium]